MMTYRKATSFKLLCILFLVSGLCVGSDGVLAQSLKVEVVKVKSAKGEFYFSTEIAKTDSERRRGLMNRMQLARDAAMLFVWEKEQPVQMWMKDTYIPLDMVFIRNDGSVANISHATKPHSLKLHSSKGRVRGVLELSAGTASKIGLREGHKVFHRAFD